MRNQPLFRSFHSRKIPLPIPLPSLSCQFYSLAALPTYPSLPHPPTPLSLLFLLPIPGPPPPPHTLPIISLPANCLASTMVLLDPSRFLCHLACPMAPFSAPYFTSFSLPVWDTCLRLGMSSVNPMRTIGRLMSTARAKLYVR